MRLANALVGLTGPPRCAACGHLGEALCRQCVPLVARPTAQSASPGVDRVIAAWEYEGPARRLVLDLKLAGSRTAAEPLIGAMARSAVRAGLIGTMVTWVPGRGRDVRRRGYNHAAVLAVGVATAMGVDSAGLLRRTRAVADQSTLGAEARRVNLRAAFAARASPPAVVLVDDLLTTGATASACARALRARGARSVEVVVACRKS